MTKALRGNLFVVSAPSGTGKTTLCERLLSSLPDIRESVSYTTRRPRPGEIQDVHYTFVDEEEFRSMITEGEFVEWARVHGNFYGTSKRRIEDLLNSGVDVLLDIDIQGGSQIRRHFPDSVLVFVFPPSLTELRRRLEGRMSDSSEVIESRLKTARDEVRQYSAYDYGIVNDYLEEAFSLLCSIIVSERARIRRMDQTWIEQEFLQED
ncbi:MAG: guanylate kinase [Chloroflexota bacterium]